MQRFLFFVKCSNIHCKIFHSPVHSQDKKTAVGMSQEVELLIPDGEYSPVVFLEDLDLIFVFFFDLFFVVVFSVDEYNGLTMSLWIFNDNIGHAIHPSFQITCSTDSTVLWISIGFIFPHVETNETEYLTPLTW